MPADRRSGPSTSTRGLAGHGKTRPNRARSSPPRGWANHPAWSPDGRWLAAIGVLEAEPLDDVSPSIIVGPADGTRPPHALDPALDRPIGNWTDTDLNGWMVSGRHGPAWLDDRRLVATVSDRGRSHPHVYTIDPTTGRTRRPSAVPSTGDRTTHTIGRRAEPDRRSAAHRLPRHGRHPGHGAVHDRRTRSGAPAPPDVVRLGLAGPLPDARDAPRRRPGPGGPIETWIASPPGAGDKALPTVVDVHGGPLGAWAPAPHIEVFLLVARGYRVVLPNIRGSATYGRDWIRRSSATGAGSMPPTSTPPSITSSSSASPIPSDSA